MKHFKPNVVRGGTAIGLGNNLFLMKGRKHSEGGIDVGENPRTGLEVEDNEVMQVTPKGVKVFSAQPILGGKSPAQYVLEGASPYNVFNAQEAWKKFNGINDDGTQKKVDNRKEYVTRRLEDYDILDDDTLALRQRFMESNFVDDSISSAGAKGAYQIMPHIHNAYVKRTGKKGDLTNYEYNKSIRDWLLSEDIGKNKKLMHDNQLPIVKLAKQYGAYNWGSGNLQKYLNSQAAKGIDINNSLDWLEGLPKETRNYINFIVLGKDANKYKTNSIYNDTLKKRGIKALGGRNITKDETEKKNYVEKDSQNNNFTSVSGFYPKNSDFLKEYRVDVKIPLKGEKNYRELKEEYKELKKELRNGNSSKSYLSLTGEIDDVGKKLALSTLINNRGISNDKYFGKTERERRELFIDRHIRENKEESKDVLDFYKSYIESEGLNRILSNQKKYFDEHKKEFNKENNLIFSSPGTNDLKYALKKASKRPIKVYDLNGPEVLSFYKPFQGQAYVFRNYEEYAKNESKKPYLETLAHEIGHHFNYITNGEKLGLNINKGYDKNGHDEKYTERQADVLAMKYLLKHSNIYDSRSNKDITSEQVKKLREIYPNIRIFKQMDSDEDIAKMLNLVAYNKNKEEKSQYSTNYAKYGGIYIKPSKRGTFTAAAKKHGMSVQGFASKVLANKDNYSPSLVKKANFVRNASKWHKKEFGGQLNNNDMTFDYLLGTNRQLYKLGGRKKAQDGIFIDGKLYDKKGNVKFDTNIDPLIISGENKLNTVNDLIHKKAVEGVGDALLVANGKIRTVNSPIKTVRAVNNSSTNNMASNSSNTNRSSDMPFNVPTFLPATKADKWSLGLNLAGNLLSTITNGIAINSMEYPKHITLRAIKQNTEYNVEPQIGSTRETVAKNERDITDNTTSSRIALNRRQLARNLGNRILNDIYGQKENIENNLVRENLYNIQNVGNQNIMSLNRWLAGKSDFNNKKQELLSENIVSGITNAVDAVVGERGYLSNIENRRTKQQLLNRDYLSSLLMALSSPNSQFVKDLISDPAFVQYARENGFTLPNIK